MNYRGEWRLERCVSESPWCADATVGGLVTLGNIQTAAGVHGAVRVGYGLTGFPAPAIPMAVAPPERGSFEIGGILGWEGRALASNGLLRATSASGDFSREPIVRDVRYGGYARFKDVRATVLWVRRSPEFEVTGIPKRSQTFASISLSYEPMVAPEPAVPRFLWRDWRSSSASGRRPSVRSSTPVAGAAAPPGGSPSPRASPGA